MVLDRAQLRNFGVLNLSYKFSFFAVGIDFSSANFITYYQQGPGAAAPLAPL